MNFHINWANFAPKKAKKYEKNADISARRRKNRKHGSLHKKSKKYTVPLTIPKETIII